MNKKIFINGFGRIGRCITKICNEKGYDILINSPGSTEQKAHLLKYDSVHGIFPCKQINDNEIQTKYGKIKCCFVDPMNYDYSEYSIVAECSGKFKEDGERFIHNNAKKVLISAPANTAQQTIVYGVNHETLTEKDNIISAASCTTNCLAVVLKCIKSIVNIKSANAITIHAYTNDQKTLDARHEDLYRSRAAGLSIIPTKTGAQKAINKIFASEPITITCHAYRVPVANVSVVDITINHNSENITHEKIDNAFHNASNTYLKNILEYVDDCRVSIDFIGSKYTANFDSKNIRIIDQNNFAISSWYDNEWGYSERFVNIIDYINKIQ